MTLTMMKRNILLLTLCLLASVSVAQDNRNDNFMFNHHRVSFSGALTSADTYQLEAAYHYMFNRMLGVGGSVGHWKVFYEEGWASGKDWNIESDDNKPSNLYLRPSVILKSPALHVKQLDIGLFAEPGVMLNIPYTSVWIRQTTQWPQYESKRISTNQGQWLAVDLRAGIYVNVGPCGFSAGYLMSNHDPYSQYRHLSYKGVRFERFYPRRSFTQGGYITASYYF